jgi:hypothetical protein
MSWRLAIVPALIPGLEQVAEEYKLSSENLYLSTNFADRFLSVMPVMRGKLQLVGVTCVPLPPFNLKNEKIAC